MNIRQSIAKSLVIAVTTMTLAACGGGDSDTAPAVADPAAAATPSTPATSTSTFAGTYTGTISSKVHNAQLYSGPASITVTRDVAGNFTVSGNWNATRTNSSGPQESVNDLLTGSVSSDGVLTATGNFKVRSMTATVDAATGQITGTYTYTGIGMDFTDDFTLAK
ncbi:MAG: hypothetical protein KBA62_05560 [Polaromonas sp.]|jgi:hypothetical protein|nr:hypothetical protein [Polaromonas sp.]MBP6142082.1 hypothetical protein [Polaromonas sp.]MBP6156245.1 hypothetical protein [Polaromonas sp.]MBP7115763.1 hypothetical protein [Polaromonas sp.]MBP7307963.1 hypothetical protein [Polaromonas sp.]